jgi:ABC-type glutathione transport system ATPase component
VTAALELRGLSKSFLLKSGFGPFARFQAIHALRGVDLVLPRRSILGLVGESGVGQDDDGHGRAAAHRAQRGRILVDGTDITTLGAGRAPALPAADAGVFQDSYSALDPMFTLWKIVGRAAPHPRDRDPTLAAGTGARMCSGESDSTAAMATATRTSSRAGSVSAWAIARALILEPEVLIADEPPPRSTCR